MEGDEISWTDLCEDETVLHESINKARTYTKERRKSRSG